MDCPEDPLTLAENAAWRLAWEQPQFSACAGISTPQRLSLFAALLLSSMLVLTLPNLSVIALGVVLAAFFTLVALFRCILLAAGLYAAWRFHKSPPDRTKLSDEELPIYSVVAPLYREPGSAQQLITALIGLDYPVHKLDIKLVLEADDDATFAAIQILKPPAHFQILRVPPLAPRTKPKACNYALTFVRGQHVVIYDAEDIPDTDQLRKAARAFHAGGPELACLQARLNYYNPRENWLTRQFTLEYSMWFDWLLPGLQALGLPIPLGGTSNHFRTPVLRNLGGWDPYNVTEDADLGLRLARKGYKCAVLHSTTMEEANCRHVNWLRQRTRWQKGYMMTWLVHMRRPVQLWRQLGVKGFLGFQLFVGGTVALALFMPAALLIFILGVCASKPETSEFLNHLNGIVFALGLGVSAISACAGAIGRQHYGLLIDILFTPLYWGLTMLASVRALWQLIDDPFIWEKTRHAISAVSPVLPKNCNVHDILDRTYSPRRQYRFQWRPKEMP
jgi:cellulose synthase/poly-beta-1,6-N-acetylglucosamine synthase-like glycosyltransferase